MEIPVVTKPLLFDYFAGRATPLQKKVIGEWLADPQHVDAYYAFLFEYESTFSQYWPQTEPTLALLEKKLEAEFAHSPPVPALPVSSQIGNSFWFRFPVWAAAACFLLLLGLGGWLGGKDLILYQTYRTDYGKLSTVLLTDGSEVTLNANSSLRVPRFSFNTGDRTVWLTGEAEFAVKKKPNQRRFRVKTSDDLDVIVLGTKFTVSNRPRATWVVLHEGRVNIQLHNEKANQQYVMKPGELIEVKPGHSLRHVTVPQPQAYSSWKHRQFSFDKTPLSDIIQQVEENFGVDVQLTGSQLGSRRLSGTFKADSAPELLRAIAELLSLQYNQTGSTIQLGGIPSTTY